MTVSCCAAPICKPGFAGVRAMLVNVTGATVRVVVPVTVPDAAEMAEEPSDMPVARPLVVTLATAGEAELKLEIAVMSLLLPSV